MSLVRRGQASRLEQIEEEIVGVLWRRGPLGFTQLQDQLSKSSEERRAGSPSTLSRCLKDLAKTGNVERDIETRKWKLTPLGRMSVVVHEQVHNPHLKTDLRQKALFVLVKEANPDAWWEFVEKVAHSLQIEKRVKDIPEAELMKNLKNYTQQTKHATTALWSGIISDMVFDVGVLIAAVALIRAMYPSPMDRDSASRMAGIIRNLVADWGKETTQNVEKIVAANVLHLEVLVALNKAIEQGKFDAGSVTEIPFSEVVKKLQALGYLKVEEEA
jgi:predicted transcriptional regulator